jgi:isoquinoline 1-oxidoreductase beta subunit
MTQQLNRRHFLITGSVAAGGLLVGCSTPSPRSRLGDTQVFRPTSGQTALNGWVKIGVDNQVIVASPRAEMGQGVYTALAMLVAEELDADWKSIRVEHAPIAKIYANTALLLNVSPYLPDDDGFVARMARSTLQALGYALSLQVTGGSSSVRDAWEPMRIAGATARALLVQAAADTWGVNTTECSVMNNSVFHTSSGRSASFGQLAVNAGQLNPPTEVTLKARQDYKLIGKSTPRTDIQVKVNGQAQFGIDITPPDVLHAAIRQCPFFGGQVKAFDATAVTGMRGVSAVVPVGSNAVAVLADNSWRAQQAIAQLPIQWDEGPNATLSSELIGKQMRADLDQYSGSSFRKVGNAARVLEVARHRIDAEYEVPFLAHTTMEPMTCVAQVANGKVTVWNGTQVPSFARRAAAKIAGVDVEMVTVNVPFLGGGFGRRLEFDMVVQAVTIALATEGRPVKLTWSREEDIQHDMYRPAAVSRFSASFDAKGLPEAWRNRLAAPSIGLATMERLMPGMAFDMPDKNQIEGAFDLPYDIPNLEVRQIRTKTPVPVGSWRSVGHSYNAFFTESFMDELAHAAKADPYIFRQGLLGKRPRHRAVLDLVATRAGWGKSLPTGVARGIALHESFASICAQVAEVSLVDGRPRVHRVVCVIDCGLVVNPDTVEAQMQSAIVYGLSAALFGEITVKDGRVEQSNFASYDAIKLSDMPVIETYIVPSDGPPGGVGEPGTPPIAPAVANALFALIGKRIRSLPLTAQAIQSA